MAKPPASSLLLHWRKSTTCVSSTMVSRTHYPIRWPSPRAAASARNRSARCFGAERAPARGGLALALRRLDNGHVQPAADRDSGIGGAVVDRAAPHRRLRGVDAGLHFDGHLPLDDLPAGSVAGPVFVRDRLESRPALGRVARDDGARPAGRARDHTDPSAPFRRPALS